MLDVSRIAVWNKRLAVVVITMCIWLINGAFIIQRESRFLSCSISYQPGSTRCHSGEYALVDISDVPGLYF